MWQVCVLKSRIFLGISFWFVHKPAYIIYYIIIFPTQLYLILYGFLLVSPKFVYYEINRFIS